MTNQADLGPAAPSGLIETSYEIGQDNIQPKIGPFGLDIHNPVFLISGLTIIAFVFFALALPDAGGGAVRLAAAGRDLDLRLVLPARRRRLRAAVPGADRHALGQDPARRQGRRAGLFLLRLVRDAVRGGHGHRPDVLRRVRADLALHVLAGGRCRHAGQLGPARRCCRRRCSRRTGSAWPRPSSTGACTPGRSTPSSGWRWHCSPTTRACRSPCARSSTRSSASGSGAGPATSSTCWRCSRPCSASRPRSGIGAEQANAGLEYLFGMPVNEVSKVVLITGITAIALISVVAGLDAGVKRLSEINMVLAAAAVAVRDLGRARPSRSRPASSATWWPTSSICRPCPARSGATIPTSARAGRRSTGPGGSPGRRSSACSSPASAGAAPCASSSSACC